MKKILNLLPVSILFVALISSCADEKNDDLGPVITINAPTQGQMFCGKKDSVIISAVIDDNDELHNVEWQIASGETILASGSAHSHDSPYTLNAKWFTDVDDHTNATVTVTASDHNDNENEVSVDIHIHKHEACNNEPE